MNRRDFLSNTLMMAPALAVGLLSKEALASEFFSEALLTCGRSPAVNKAIELLSGKKCDAITEEDLLSLQDLTLRHIHLPNFQETDFEGLANLKKLTFRSLFHKPSLYPDVKAFSGSVFAPLTSLEHLVIDETLDELEDYAFSELKKLKILDLQYSEMTVVPRSLLDLQQLEQITCYPGGFSEVEFAKIKEAFGDRLKTL